MSSGRKRSYGHTKDTTILCSPPDAVPCASGDSVRRRRLTLSPPVSCATEKKPSSAVFSEQAGRELDNGSNSPLPTTPHLLVPRAEVEATEADDRTEDIAPAPGLLKNALAPVMDAAASRVACTARPMMFLSRSALVSGEKEHFRLLVRVCLPRWRVERAVRAGFYRLGVRCALQLVCVCSFLEKRRRLRPPLYRSSAADLP